MTEFRALDIAGLIEVMPKRFRDDRGYFSETWKSEWAVKLGLERPFVQDNQSLSRSPGVLRGLHYQVEPAAQDKLVRVLRGAVFDVALDIRPGSSTFGKWSGLVLSAERGNQLFVPRGFAHGFVTIEPDTEIAYKVSASYSPEHERAIRFDDPAIGIAWPGVEGAFILSEKDRDAPTLAEATRVG